MNDWQECSISELCTDIIDCVNKTAPLSPLPTPYRMLRTSDIRNGFINLENLNCVTEEVFTKWTRRGALQEGDVIFTREAPLGEAGIVREARNYFLGQRLVLYRANPAVCDNRFLLYWFLNPINKDGLKTRGVGSTVSHMRVPECERIKVTAPPLQIQHRIADILSAYDSLIETNQRQIKLLEEAAQRLYREWFVDLRFPGHEDVPVVDGVPEGWKKERLVDIAEVQYGYAFDGMLFNTDREGTPIVRIRNIPDGTTEDYTTERADDQYLVVNGDIVVGMDGEFHINSWSGQTAYLVQRTCRIRPKAPNMNGWLLWAIHEPIKYFEKTVVGATVAHLGKKHIDTITLLTGTEELYKPFQDMFEKRQTLLNQNRALSEARDRLLPKLMSGEIAV